MAGDDEEMQGFIPIEDVFRSMMHGVW